MENNTLIIALSSYAGMGPYVASIVNAFAATDPVWFVLCEDDRHYFTKNIRRDLLEKCLIIYRADSKYNKLKSLLFSDSSLIKQISRFIEKKNIAIIHMLASCLSLRGAVLTWQEKFKVFMTIHDLHPHEAHKAFYKMWRHRRMYRLLDCMREDTSNLITNSRAQYEELLGMYPDKKVFFHEFPSLVTDSIRLCQKKVPELKGVCNYILFFGRIEAYKGIDVLYNAWCDCEDLNKEKILVIAGSGDIYFSRRADERNVIFINRYIQDEEVADLYHNAVCSVYPYISASQSGVLSLSCFFKIPILASNVPFFKTVDNYGLGRTFENGNTEQLAKQLVTILQYNEEERLALRTAQSEYYDNHYDAKAIRQTLLKYYTE